VASETLSLPTSHGCTSNFPAARPSSDVGSARGGLLNGDLARGWGGDRPTGKRNGENKQCKSKQGQGLSPETLSQQREDRR
jgi:hypothetical protein